MKNHDVSIGIGAFILQRPWFFLLRLLACLALLLLIIAVEWYIIQFMGQMTLALNALQQHAFYMAVLNIVVGSGIALGLSYFFERIMLSVQYHWRLFLTKMVIWCPKWFSLLHNSTQDERAKYNLALQESVSRFTLVIPAVFRSLKSLLLIFINDYALYRFTYALQIGSFAMPGGYLILAFVYAIGVNLVSYFLGNKEEEKKQVSDNKESKFRADLNRGGDNIRGITATYQGKRDFQQSIFKRLICAIKYRVLLLKQGIWRRLFDALSNSLIIIIPWLIISPALFSGQLQLAQGLIFLRLFYKIFHHALSIIKDYFSSHIVSAYRQLRLLVRQINASPPLVPIHLENNDEAPSVALSCHFSTDGAAAMKQEVEINPVIHFSCKKVCLTGERGSGQSTFLALLSGEVPVLQKEDAVTLFNIDCHFPLGQEVVLSDENAWDYLFPPSLQNDPDLAADFEGVVYAFDDGWRNEIGLDSHGVAVSADDRLWLEEAWHRLGLEGRDAVSFSDLSIGERRRVFNLRYLFRVRLAVMASQDLQRNARVMISMDKMLGACDPEYQLAMHDLFKDSLEQWFGERAVIIFTPAIADDPMKDQACHTLTMEEIHLGGSAPAALNVE